MLDKNEMKEAFNLLIAAPDSELSNEAKEKLKRCQELCQSCLKGYLLAILDDCVRYSWASDLALALLNALYEAA